MKVYFYLKHFSADGNELNDGLRKAVHGLVSGLVACRVKVTVLCEGLNNSSFETKFGYNIECFANPKKYQTVFVIAPKLKQYIREYANNSLVILNGIFNPSIYSMSCLLKTYAIPYIVAPHDPYHPSIFSKNPHLKWPYWYIIEQRVLKQARALQVLDSRHARWLRRLGIQTPIIETPNGFSPDDVYPESSLRWRKDGTAKLFFLGRLDSYNKGLDILLNAFAQIVEFTNAELVIQGPDWGDRKTLKEKAARLLPYGKVSFFEPDYSKSSSLIIADYDVFCLPSRYEGFSLSALEAMLSGRVLLVSEVAGIAPHVISSGCGVVIKPEVSSVKAGLIELLQRRAEWKEMGISGRRYALDHLQWNKIASAALEQYKQIAS